MLRLIEHSRTMNAAEADIRVICMDLTAPESAPKRDAGMAGPV